jgi:hypothetical protein
MHGEDTPSITRRQVSLIYIISQKAQKAQGEPIRDPFRRAFGSAVQWYDCLKVTVRRSIENAIEQAHDSISTSSQSVPSASPDIEGPKPSAPNVPSYYKPSSTHAARLLQKRCPACFGGHMKGRSLDECVIVFHIIYRVLTSVSAAVTVMWRLMVTSTIGTWPVQGTAHHFMIRTTLYRRRRWTQ